jgi:trimethylamine:corrinoid methyltransferase-like protein
MRVKQSVDSLYLAGSRRVAGMNLSVNLAGWLQAALACSLNKRFIY